MATHPLNPQSPALALLAALVTIACTDAALENQPVQPPSDIRQDANEVADTADTGDIPDIACTSNEVCRDLLTGLTLCEEAVCGAASGRCEIARRADCCLGDSDCPALADPCLTNRCPVAGGTCIAIDNCAPCTFDSDCDAQAPTCTAGACTEGLCVFSPLPTCCVDARDCDDADICTTATCEGGLCLHRDTAITPNDGCCRTPPALETSFSPAPEFVVTSTATDAGWYVRTTNFTPSPPAALYLGNRNSPFNTSDAGAYSAEARFRIGTTRPGAIEVKFQTYLDIRDIPNVDRFRVTLVSTSGAERLVYAKNVATLGAWHPVKRSILVEESGPWTLVFAFDAVDRDPDRKVGIFIDDLQVRTSCGGELCTSDRDCASDDPCILGRCADGECLFLPNPDCAECQTDAQCADATICTDDRCIGGRCASSSVPGCCNGDDDCDDGDNCTTDRCRTGAGLCFYERDPVCDVCIPADCDDGDPCTRDICTANGCLNQRDPDIAGCACSIDRDCDDGDRCTTDQCVDGVCRYSPAVGADGRLVCECGGPNPCDDGDPCTRDVCDNGQCRFIPDANLPGCSVQCTSDDQCPPPTTCSETFCDVGAGRCVTRSLPGCCSSVADCNDGRICTEDSCTADGRCIHQLRPGCCETAAACDDNNACTVDRCDAATGTCVSTPLSGCCTANTQCNDNNACTSDSCVNGQCTFTPIANCCTANTQCNDNNACTSDSCVNGQCTFTPVANCCTANTQCNDSNACTTDSCIDGQCRFAPIPNCCTANSQCNDNNACTNDTCVNGQCVTAPIAGCCTNDGQCNDNNVCTADRCDTATNQCQRSPIAGCCTSDAQCNDNDACTTDACVNNQCTFTPNNGPGCTATGCTTDAECDDGARCTANQCENGQCRTLPILGCCTSVADCNDNNVCTNDFCFEAVGLCFSSARTCNDNNACTLDTCDSILGCVFSPDPSCVCEETILWERSFVDGEDPDIEIEGLGFGGLQWRVDSVLAVSPTLSLRYGNAAGTNYANGFRTFGRATGPTLGVNPAAGSVRLDFMVYVDIDRTPDSFRARAVFSNQNGNQNVIVWDHVELDQTLYRQWVPISVTLPSGAIGQDVRIRFVFDSVDGVGNLGQGVAVDDIVVSTTCP